MTNENNGKPRRVFHGAIWDVNTAAEALGTTEKAIRAMVARQVIPYRRLNRRIIFIRAELLQFIDELAGCNLEEAKRNVRIRRENG